MTSTPQNKLIIHKTKQLRKAAFHLASKNLHVHVQLHVQMFHKNQYYSKTPESSHKNHTKTVLFQSFKCQLKTHMFLWSNNQNHYVDCNNY